MSDTSLDDYLHELNRNYSAARQTMQKMAITVDELEQQWREWFEWRDAHPNECAQALATLKRINEWGSDIRKAIGPRGAAILALRLGKR